MGGVFDNPAFPYFAFYATVCIVKTMLMSFVTAIQRFRVKAFINAEDCRGKKKDGKYLQPGTHESVERIRRCHLNDLENVLPFILIGVLYVATGPVLGTAILHFRLFTGARLFHTVAYLLPIPQPARAVCFAVGFFTTISMAVNILMLGNM